MQGKYKNKKTIKTINYQYSTFINIYIIYFKLYTSEFYRYRIYLRKSQLLNIALMLVV